MKLYYYKRLDKVENFGDSLNPWLWNQFINQELDEDEATAFVGIGTLLNRSLPDRAFNTNHFVVFSSGVGYEDNTIAQIENRSTIYCVRGHLSAQKMDLPKDKAITDGAMLLRRIFSSSNTTIKYKFSFMPHVEQAMLGDYLMLEGNFWHQVCQQAGMNYIDPRWDIQTVLSLISQTQVLLAEAMHGAIAAEALRVPWIPIITTSRILAFKWLDWCSSLNLDYQPHHINSLISNYPFADGQLEWNQNWLVNLQQAKTIDPQTIINNQIELIATQFELICQTGKENLADDRLIEDLTIKLEEQLDQFKSDVKAGKFNN